MNVDNKFGSICVLNNEDNIVHSKNIERKVCTWADISNKNMSFLFEEYMNIFN